MHQIYIYFNISIHIIYTLLTFSLNTPASCTTSDRNVPELIIAQSALVAVRATSATRLPNNQCTNYKNKYNGKKMQHTYVFTCFTYTYNWIRTSLHTYIPCTYRQYQPRLVSLVLTCVNLPSKVQ